MTALLDRFWVDVVRRLDLTSPLSLAASGSSSESAPLLQHSASCHATPLDTGPPVNVLMPSRLITAPDVTQHHHRLLYVLLLRDSRRRHPHGTRRIETFSSNRRICSAIPEASGIRIRACVEEAENFLEVCGRPRDRWSRFILSWLGTNEAQKVRRFHFLGDAVFYEKFLDGLYTLFKRLDFENAYRQQLRVLAQSGSESVAAFASRTSDFTTRAYFDFPTELQLDLTVDHFISGFRDLSTQDYLRRKRARRRIKWHEAVQMAQACEPSHAA